MTHGAYPLAIKLKFCFMILAWLTGNSGVYSLRLSPKDGVALFRLSPMSMQSASLCKRIEMLEFFFRGAQFRIGFAYETVHKCRGAKCFIDRLDAGEWKQVSQGWAQCLPQDPFVKETGRLLSLRRATGKSGWLTLEKLPPESAPATHHWVSTFPEGWDRKAWSAAAWACYMGRKTNVAAA